MPSTTRGYGRLDRQIVLALAAGVVAGLFAVGQGLATTLIDLSRDTVWLLTAAAALSALASAVAGGAAGYAAGMGDTGTGTVLRTAAVFAGVAVLAFAGATVAFGLLGSDTTTGPPLVAAAGVAERTVPFVAGGVAGAALSLARGASYSAADPN
ncbi:hypothetical protein GRX01_01090 [Halobaculum sp. WSA2]|uniref:Uncharacterized protein n=1 Tax=Halobaculum saliterrae TaxID=2073113 RepID=A0A6B0SQX8_9EURY|nr:hypothetical protein [Halobaculum saliterrae]MXR39956.1 hypothetical protein [Halobaculum saliterrae]